MKPESLLRELEMLHALVQTCTDSVELSRVLELDHTRIVLAYTADRLWTLFDNLKSEHESQQEQGETA